MKEKEKRIVAVIVLFATLIFLAACVVVGWNSVKGCIYAFRNPELTLTQIIIYNLNDLGSFNWIIAGAVSYMILLVASILYEK